MNINNRSYLGDGDKPLMINLAARFPSDNLHVTDLPYRLSSWALDDMENTHLWFDAEMQLVAGAVLQSPFWEVDIVCHPGFENQLYPEILEWADQRAVGALDTLYGHPTWFINVFSWQVNRMRSLEEAGYQCQSGVSADSPAKVLMLRSGQAPVKNYIPPIGYSVRPLSGEKEAVDYVDLHRSVFSTKNMTVEWRLRAIRHPLYNPDLDIIVQSSDGRLVAFCICWFDGASLDGRVEPLGCHQDFRRYALGRVALSEGLQRLQLLGARTIHVETDIDRNTAFSLYQSFGFEVEQKVLVFEKRYRPSQ